MIPLESCGLDAASPRYFSVIRRDLWGSVSGDEFVLVGWGATHSCVEQNASVHKN